ncbi:Rap1a/Tai family immunity protein [Pseudomonas lini]
MNAGIAAGVVLVAALGCGQALADGYNLLEHCQQAVRAMDKTLAPTDEPMSIGRCFGMVEGVRNTLVILNSKLPDNFKVCFPKKGIDNGQAVRIVDKFLRDNPAMLDQPDTFLVMMAFKQAYPCMQ